MENKPRKTIGDWMRSLTPEEKRKFFEERTRKRQERDRIRLEHREEMRRKALAFVAQDEMQLAHSKNYSPSQELVKTIAKQLAQGKDLNSLRVQFFSDCPQEAWEKITHAVGKYFNTGAEHQGAQIEAVKEERVRLLHRRLRDLKKLYKDSKKSPMIQLKCLENIHKTEDEITKAKMEAIRTHRYVGSYMEKQRGGTAIHIHTNIPRPEPRDVTPEKEVIEQSDGD